MIIQNAVATLATNIPIHIAQQALPLSPAPFSSTRFFAAVISGLVLTFAFQMLLTNFSIALGITALGMGNSIDDGDQTSELGLKTIGIGMGLWTLVSVSLALFGACALALKLSLVTTLSQAITLALVIWATYFTVLVWVSSTTVGTLIGSIVSTATTGFQSIFGTASMALGAKAVKSELMASTEEAFAAVRRQVTADIDAEDIQDSLQEYLDQLRSPTLDLSDLRQEFETLLKDPSISSLEPIHLQSIDRAAFEQLVRDRTDISKHDRQRLVDRMERAWTQAIGQYQKRDRMGELIEFVKHSTPQSLLTDGLSSQLEQLIREYREQQNDTDVSVLSQAFNTVMAIIMGRIDFSDLEVEQMMSQIKQAKSQVVEQVDQAYDFLGAEADSPTIIGLDVENYILTNPSWRFTPELMNQDFRAVLFDSEANLETIKQQISGLLSKDFRQLLGSRGIFTQQKIVQIDNELKQICRDVMHGIEETLESRKREVLSKKTYTYFRYTPKYLLDTANIYQSLGALLQDDDADVEQLSQRFLVINRMALMKPLQHRDDLNPEEMNQILDDVQWAIKKTIAEAESIQAEINLKVQKKWQQTQDYLRNTGKEELNPQDIQRDLEALLDEPSDGLEAIKTRVAQFDRDTLVQLLSQRQDLSETEVNDVLDRVEAAWMDTKHAPAILTAKMQAKYQAATNAIADYLLNTGKSELHPEGIHQDLTLLLEDPKAGYDAIMERIARMDRDTLVQIISQRNDFTESEVQDIVAHVQHSLQQLVNAPKRLARRSRAQFESFQSNLEDYLTSTDKAELSPEGIKRDFQALLHDPRWGLQRLSDRLSQVDESTLIALISQRDDMTEEDAREAVGQLIAVRDEAQAKLTEITHQVQSVLNSLLERIRQYLNGLERPELNYDDIRRDIQTLLDDPDAGFEALRDRLSRFDRNTLIAIVSSHDSISEQDINQVIHQIESTRTSILQRAERVQVRLQERLERLKQQAEEQVEATRKTAAIAAWWLFATAVCSGAAAALGATLSI